MTKKQPTEHGVILMALNELCTAVGRLAASQVVLVRTLVAIFELGEDVEG